MNRITANTNRNITPAFRNVEDLLGYANYILMQCQLAGCFTLDGHKPTQEELNLCADAKKIALRIESVLRNCKDEEVSLLLEAYDLLYRIGYRAVTPQGYISNQKERVFKAWSSGNKRIEESTIMRMLYSKILIERDSMPSVQVNAYETLYSNWIKTMKQHSYFPDATTYENYQRLAILMPSCLKGETVEDEESLKWEWYHHNKIDDYSKVSTKILESYRSFQHRLPSFIKSFEDVIEEDNRILLELTNRTVINLYKQKNYQLALKFNSIMWA